MNITVAGKDRTGDLGVAVAAEAARLKSAGAIGALSPQHSALVLKASLDREDYQRRFIGLLQLRHGLRTTDYFIPRGPGLRGKTAVALRSLLWKLLRYQHDRMSFQQNMLNELTFDALEFQQGQMKSELAHLKKRLEDLERERAKGAAP